MPEATSAAKPDKAAWHAAWLKKWQAEQKQKAQAASTATQNASASDPTASAAAKTPNAVSSTPQASAAPTSKSVAVPVASSAPPAAVKAPNSVPATAAGKAPVRAVSTPAASAKTAKSTANAFAAQTKPDGDYSASSTGHAATLDSPLTAIGDGGRMLMTMLPVLLLIVGGLHLLRRWQQRTGRLPGLVQSLTRDPESRSAGGWKRNRGGGLQALLGAFQQSQSTGRTGGIRLVESLPLGGANLHVVEVRGRALLLGVTGASVQTLAELTEPRASESNEFMAHLQAATADLDALDLEDPETPIETLVGSLESVMQETHAAVNRRVRRLRTVRQEDEDADAA